MLEFMLNWIMFGIILNFIFLIISIITSFLAIFQLNTVEQMKLRSFIYGWNNKGKYKYTLPMSLITPYYFIYLFVVEIYLFIKYYDNNAEAIFNIIIRKYDYSIFKRKDI